LSNEWKNNEKKDKIKKGLGDDEGELLVLGNKHCHFVAFELVIVQTTLSISLQTFF